MKETTNSPNCERASDLIAFLYDEADERERRDFELHLNECNACREEVASFGVVRESITAWRDEALAGFVSRPIATTRKSALAAFTQFFDLSPLWLKGATAFGALAVCVLAAMAFVNLQSNNVQVPSTTNSSETASTYTQAEVDQLVQQAFLKGKSEHQPVMRVDNIKSPKPAKSQNSANAQFAKSRRPLSKAEREQLAADLRLLSTDDDANLHLLGDRINQ